MLCRLSITNLSAALFFCLALSLCGEVEVAPVRLPGSSLDTSLRNEADRAVSQAALWLAARQNPSGAWGESNSVLLTSVSLLALKASKQPQYSDACARAALWLDSSATNNVADLDAHAWRLLAVAQMLPAAPSRTRLLRRLADLAKPAEANASAAALAFWQEALAAADLGKLTASPPPGAPAALSADAAAWPPAPSSNRSLWQLARRINREGGGQLVRGNTPLDWRADLAKRLVNAQRRAPGSGCYWEAEEAELQVAETAFGVLCLAEL